MENKKVSSVFNTTLEEARAIWKTIPHDKPSGWTTAERFTQQILLDHFTEEELQRNTDIDEMYAAWKLYIKDTEEVFHLPYTIDDVKVDSKKAVTQAFAMLQHIVEHVNKNVPKPGRYWIPYFYNSGFCVDGSTWSNDDDVFVCFRLRYNSKEVCDKTVKKYEPIYKVYQTK